MSYAQAFHQQVSKAFPGPNAKDPVGDSLQYGVWGFWKCHHRKSPQAPLEGDQLPSTPDPDTAANLEGISLEYTSHS